MGIYVRYFFSDVYYALNNLKYRLSCRHIQIGHKVKVLPGSKLHGYNLVGHRSALKGELGYGSYIGYDCEIYNARFGKYCSVGPRVHFVEGSHPVHNCVSTHPAFYTVRNDTHLSYTSKPIGGGGNTYEIGNDVYIGQDSLFIRSVKVGDGAVIGAGALVTKDVEPYSIVAGVPAKTIGYRFSKEQNEEMIKCKWWEKSPEWLREHSDFFGNIEAFLKLAREQDD